MNINSISFIAALGVAAGVMADQTATPATAPFKLNLSEEYGYYNFVGTKSSLNEFNTTLEFDFGTSVVARVALPVYSQGSETNVGDVSLSFEATVLKNQDTILGLFHDWSLSVNAGVDVPTETAFASTNVNPFFGAEFDANLSDSLTFSQSAEYTFVGGGAYVPLIGEFTNSDILNFQTDLSMWFTKEVSVAASFVQQYYVDASEYQLFIGPMASYEMTHYLNFNAGVLLPITQTVSDGGTDYVIHAGVEFTF